MHPHLLSRRALLTAALASIGTFGLCACASEEGGPRRGSARSQRAWTYTHFGEVWDGRYLAVAATAADDVWAFGARTGDMRLIDPFLDHYDGETWRSGPVPDDMPEFVSFELAAAGTGTLWLLGRPADGTPTAYRWEGGGWRMLPKPPDVGGAADASMVPNGGAGLAAVGDEAWLCHAGGVLHWDGSSWRDTQLPFSARAIAAASPADDAEGATTSEDGEDEGALDGAQAPPVWVVGSRSAKPYSQPATARWRDGAWQQVKTPSFRFPDPLPPEASAALDTVVAEDSRRLWALGDHTFNHGEVDEEPDDEEIVVEWDGNRWKKHRVPRLPRAVDAAATVADGAGGLLLDSRVHLDSDGDVHKVAQPPDVAGRDGTTPSPSKGRTSTQTMHCERACLLPGTRTVLGVGAVEFASDDDTTPSRPAVFQYRAP